MLGDAVYHGDVLANGGLDDRLSRGQVLERAEKLMADAVHADHHSGEFYMRSPSPMHLSCCASGRTARLSSTSTSSTAATRAESVISTAGSRP